MRKTLLFSLLSLLSCGLFAQDSQPFFYYLFADHGLSSDKTTAVVQDYMGFVWVGTEDGLNRLDSFEQIRKFQFDRDNPETLSNDHITVFFEDSRQRLWVGTDNGLNLFHRNDDSFQRITFPHAVSEHGDGRVLDIKEDAEGNLWLICNDHLVELDGTTLKEKDFYHIEDEQLNLIKLTFFESRLRVGSSKGIYTLADGALQKSDMAANEPVTDLLTVGNELWIGTVANGVLRYNAISGKVKNYRYNAGKGQLSTDHVTGLALIDNTSIWIGSINGITTINRETEESRQIRYDFENAFSLSGKMVRQIYQDRGGVVWVTTPNSGVSYYHKADNIFGYYGQSKETGTSYDLMDYGVLSIFGEGDETWLGSGKGLSWFKDGEFKHYPVSNKLRMNSARVLSIAKQGKNTFWLGTENGLLKWNLSTKKYEWIASENLKGRKINVVEMARNGSIWLGTEEQGLQSFDPVTSQFSKINLVEPGQQRQEPAINDVLKLDENRLLIATAEGLFYKNEEGFDLVRLSAFLEGSDDAVAVNVLEKDEQGNILIGTREDGLLALSKDLKLLYKVGKDQGMVSEDVRSIVAGVDQALWVTTTSGASRLQRSSGRVTKVKNYDLQDGLQSNHFSERSSSTLPDGRILFGGFSGLTIFHPDDVIDVSIDQNLSFLSLSIKGHKVKPGAEGSPLSQAFSLTDQVTLNPDQNNFTIEFNALDYTRPGDVTYRYQLKGYDAGWIEQQIDGTVTYQNLRGGRTYEFIVQSKGRFSGWSPEKKLTITVKPVFYETLLFQVLTTVAFGLFVAVMLWWRTRRTAEKEKELESLIIARSTELHEEVNIRRETEKKLTEALSQAERASEVKSQFLANMSHEIRTPLNGIMGMTELSLETELSEEQYTMLDTVHKSALSLRSIVSDILDIAKIEAGELKIVKEKFSIGEVMEQVMASFQLQANQKNLSLKHWVLPKVPGLLFGDAGRLRQVMVNLVANAMKFTHSGSITVIVDAMNQRATGLELWFTVTDTGIGISEYQQENIFKSFVQVDNGPSRVYGGTGLGLSISKELVEKMGGEIWVESDEGKGSIFSFYVRMEEYIQEENLIPTDEIVANDSTFKGQVLLVEDNATNQLVVAKMLEKMGLTVEFVNNGRSALELLKAQSYDLVLMDLQMPDIDGLETTRLIRSSEFASSNVPIIALTGAAMAGSEERCLAAGMNGFLAKPITFKELKQCIHPYLSNTESSPA